MSQPLSRLLLGTENVYISKSSRISSKREAEVIARITELKKQGLWSSQRLPKLVRVDFAT